MFKTILTSAALSLAIAGASLSTAQAAAVNSKRPTLTKAEKANCKVNGTRSAYRACIRKTANAKQHAANAPKPFAPQEKPAEKSTDKAADKPSAKQ